MRLKPITFWATMCLIATSCIRDEAPNAEADIESCTVVEDVLKREPQITNDRVVLLPKHGADIKNLTLEFTLTPGATIDPPSGEKRDYTTPQTYTVTSEDKKWTKEYTVYCSISDIQTRYDFEHYELVGALWKYYQFYEEMDGEKQTFWASGNSGLVVAYGSKYGPDYYPTVTHSDGKSGNCVKLETKTMQGTIAAGMGIPMAAGNLFIGEFDGAHALSAPLEVTHFGVPFTKEPVALTGYYKFKAGDVFTDKDGNDVPGKKDVFDIYGILYEIDDNVKYLDGTNSLTSPNLVSIARLEKKDRIESDEWIHFNLPFEMQPGKSFDTAKLAQNKYYLSVVLTSSEEGASFQGAVGSTLYVDEVEVVCK